MSKILHPAVCFEHVHFAYPNAHETLHGMSFALAGNSFTVVIGPSGSGKSTILGLVAGLAKPSSGTVRNELRTRMVFQTGALLPWRTALENVELGLADRAGMSDAEKRRRAEAALAELGIASFAKQYPRELSGGQRQRVGIARALVAEPELLLLDEPFSALDAETTAKLVAEVDELFRAKNITMLMVSHSIEDAVLLADEILLVRAGRIDERISIPLERPRARGSTAVRSLVERVGVMLRG